MKFLFFSCLKLFQYDKEIMYVFTPSGILKDWMNTTRYLWVQLHSCFQEFMNSCFHESMLLYLCTALIMMQYLGSIICSTNKIDPKIFLHRIHKYLVNPRFKMKLGARNHESILLCLCTSLIMMQYLDSIICSTNKIDPF